MNKLAIIAAAALTAATFGAAAIAQDNNTTGDFGAADANKDTWVSWDEALAVYPTLTQELFSQADANADGNLDEAEFTALVGLTAGLDGTSSSEASSSEASSSSAQ
jgi:hypothetical protein